MIKLLTGIYLIIGLVYVVLIIVSEFNDVKDIYTIATKHWQKIAISIVLIVVCIPFIILGPIILIILLIFIMVDKIIQLIRGV